MPNNTQVSRRVIAPKRVEEIPLEDIIVGHRYRQDLGTEEQMDELIDSIRQNGLLHNLVVKETVDNKYHLMCGGRRYNACKRLGYTKIACNIYAEDLTQLERNVIELSENIDRKDMNYQESVNLTKQIHKAMQALHGASSGGRGHSEGHNMRNTARMIGKSVGTVSEDIKLADMLEVMPELGGLKNKKEAMKLLKTIGVKLEAEEQVKVIEGKRKKTGVKGVRDNVSSSFLIGDVFEEIKKVEKGTVHLVELDPPYGIRLDKTKQDNLTSMGDYNEWAGQEYADKIHTLLEESYRITKEDGWLLFWFGIDPWFRQIADAIQDVGYKMNEIPALWIKPTGQCMQPYKYMANSYETFFYARKGDAKINKPGKPNYYRYKPIAPDSKVHPTEKPIELYDDILSTFTRAGDIVCSPLAGSGNSLLSSYNNHCSAFGWDLSEDNRNSFVLKALANDPGDYNSYGGK